MAKKLWHNLLRSSGKKYYIRGTSSNVGGTETFNIQFIDDDAVRPSATETITCDVDANGNWGVEYSDKKIYSLYQFAKNNNNILTIEFTEELSLLTTLRETFMSCSHLTDVEFTNATFASLGSLLNAFYGCSRLTNVNFNHATFANVGSANDAFRSCIVLTSIDFTNATFENLSSAYDMFYLCYALTTIDLSNATFSNLTNAVNMFARCESLVTLDLHSATFGKIPSVNGMFAQCKLLQSIDLSSATFAEVTDGRNMFYNDNALTTITWSQNLNFNKVTRVDGKQNVGIAMFQGCSALTSIDFGNQQFAALTNADSWFSGCTSLVSIDLGSASFASVTNCSGTFSSQTAMTTLNVPQNSTAIVPTSTPTAGKMDLHSSPLTYASMLKVANWLSDLSGQTAHTCTFKTSAWNALSSAEQTEIDAILSAKNWTRAIA